MADMKILYRKARQYKYVLAADYAIETGLLPSFESEIEGLVRLSATGRLEVLKGYAWDGPSGPALDTNNFMRGSLVHDALYQLLREGLLPQECRDYADRLLQKICLEDGMSQLRAWWVYQGVRIGGGPHAALDLLTAP